MKKESTETEFTKNPVNLMVTVLALIGAVILGALAGAWWENTQMRPSAVATNGTLGAMVIGAIAGGLALIPMALTFVALFDSWDQHIDFDLVLNREPMAQASLIGGIVGVALASFVDILAVRFLQSEASSEQRMLIIALTVVLIFIIGGASRKGVYYFQREKTSRIVIRLAAGGLGGAVFLVAIFAAIGVDAPVFNGAIIGASVGISLMSIPEWLAFAPAGIVWLFLLAIFIFLVYIFGMIVGAFLGALVSLASNDFLKVVLPSARIGGFAGAIVSIASLIVLTSILVVLSAMDHEEQ